MVMRLFGRTIVGRDWFAVSSFGKYSNCGVYSQQNGYYHLCAVGYEGKGSGFFLPYTVDRQAEDDGSVPRPYTALHGNEHAYAAQYEEYERLRDS